MGTEDQCTDIWGEGGIVPPAVQVVSEHGLMSPLNQQKRAFWQSAQCIILSVPKTPEKLCVLHCLLVRCCRYILGSSSLKLCLQSFIFLLTFVSLACVEKGMVGFLHWVWICEFLCLKFCPLLGCFEPYSLIRWAHYNMYLSCRLNHLSSNQGTFIHLAMILLCVCVCAFLSRDKVKTGGFPSTPWIYLQFTLVPNM